MTSASSQNLQDQLDEVKLEREDLRRKANTAERYRQKLEAMQSLEKDVQSLRSQLEESRKHAQQVEDAQQGLELTIQSYRQTVANIEQTSSEYRTAKQHLEETNHNLLQRWESMNEDRLRDTEVISELQERIRELETATAGKNEGKTLQSQLSEAQLNEDDT